MNKGFLLILIFITILFNSCKKDEVNSNLGNFKIVINNGPTLTANFVDAPVANDNNTFSSNVQTEP